MAFFFVGFGAVYVAQPFINPYLAQVHDQGYAALGVYSSLFALGTVVIVQVMGRFTDRWGPRAGAASVLGLMATGSLMLLVGANPGVWALAMVCCGSFDTFRYVPTMILPDSFGHMPLPWGYAIFDTLTGVPMVCGATLGGLFYRTSFALPFQVAIVVAGGLLALTLLERPRHWTDGRAAGRLRKAAPGSDRTRQKEAEMGLFDTVKLKANALAADAGRAGKVSAAQARTVVLQNDIRKAERELGHSAFSLIESGAIAHPDLEAATARLRDARQALADKEAEIEALRGRMPAVG